MSFKIFNPLFSLKFPIAKNSTQIRNITSIAYSIAEFFNYAPYLQMEKVKHFQLFLFFSSLLS